MNIGLVKLAALIASLFGAAAPAAAESAPFLFFFAHDSAALDREAIEVVRQAARAYQEGGYGNSVIRVVGHADRVGPPGVNLGLSRRRAAAVRRALIRAGAPAWAVETIGHGETRPLVETADGVAEPRNRYAVLEFATRPQ